MDLSQLEPLGKVAGIGGMALGVVVPLIHRLIGTIAGVPKNDRARIVTFIAAGCFAIGILGIAAWTFSNQPRQPQASTSGSQSPAIVSGKNASVSYGATPVAQPDSAAPNAPSGATPNGTVHTQGNQSPAMVTGGNAMVQYGTTPSATPSSETKK
jgi:hypothetical protein